MRANLKKVIRDEIERSNGRAKDLGPKWTMGYGPTTQKTLYRFFVNKIDFTGLNVLDLMCGYGEFKMFLDANDIDYGKYVGVEGSKEIIKNSRKKYREENIDIRNIVWPLFTQEQYDRLKRERFDIVVVIGSLYTFGQNFDIADEILDSLFELVDTVVFDWRLINEEEYARKLGSSSFPHYTAFPGVESRLFVILHKEGKPKCLKHID